MSPDQESSDVFTNDFVPAQDRVLPLAEYRELVKTFYDGDETHADYLAEMENVSEEATAGAKFVFLQFRGESVYRDFISGYTITNNGEVVDES